MQTKVIIYCVIVVLIVSLCAIAYSFYNKSNNLQHKVSLLEDQLLNRNNLIVSLENTIKIQQQHTDNLTNQFQEKYNILHTSINTLLKNEESKLSLLLKDNERLVELYNKLNSNNNNEPTYISVIGSVDSNCVPQFKLTQHSESTSFTISNREVK